MPEKWTGDRDRCRAAGIGDEVPFATKPALAEKMIGPGRGRRECRSPGSPGDEVYGGNPGLRVLAGRAKASRT